MARPVSFDRNEVLGQATALFLERGYCETSIAQLVKATHLQPGSLYAAFQSKEGLFLAALDYYAQQKLKRVRDAFAQAADPLQGAERFLQIAASDCGVEDTTCGCLLVNTVLEAARHNPRVRERVQSHLGEVRQVVVAALTEAQRQGLLAADKSPDTLATFLMTTVWGLRVFGGSGGGEQAAQEVVAYAVQVVRS